MERWRTSFINLEQNIHDVAHGLFVSGELVSKSGIYRAEHTGGICASEAVMVRGSRLPLCSECHQPLFFRLKKPVPHLSEDEDFGGEMIMN
jgi:hypothetical protein